MSANNDDLIAGWRYLATLQLNTPLAFLERDAEYSPGFKEPSPVGPITSSLEDGTGFNSFGMWLQEIDHSILPPSPNEQRASELGSIRVGSSEERELVSFLKSFRYIVETAETLDQQLSELKELSTSTEGNKTVWSKYSKGDPLWPDSYFIGQLWIQLPKGVGPAKAKNLYLAGFRTIEEIRAASDENLLRVDGLGKGLLRKLRDFLIKTSA